MDTNQFVEIPTGDVVHSFTPKDAMRDNQIQTITISDPYQKKELIQTSTFYILTIKDKNTSFHRKFSDFFNLRKKFVEKWPGVYIPNVPHKRSIEKIVTNVATNIIKQNNDNDQKLITSRMRILQKFFQKSWDTPYLRDSPETEVFLSNSKDFEKALENLPKENFSVIFERFKKTFSSVPENFNLDLTKKRISEFRLFIETSLNNFRFLRQRVDTLADRKQSELESFVELISGLPNFEKYSLQAYDQRNNSYIFGDSQLIFKIEEFKKNLNNPYNEFLQWIEDEELDIEAVIEAIDGINNLYGSKDKLNTKIKEIENEITEKKEGKNTIKSFFGITKKEDELNDLEQTKKNLIKELNDLNSLISISFYHLNSHVEEIKKQKLSKYYEIMKRLAVVQKLHSSKINEFWLLLENNDKLKEF